MIKRIALAIALALLAACATTGDEPFCVAFDAESRTYTAFIFKPSRQQSRAYDAAHGFAAPAGSRP